MGLLGHTLLGLSAAMMSGDLFLAQTQELCCVVVKNVSLLLGTQETRRLNGLDRHTDGLRPLHLVGTEHNALRKTRFNEGAEMVIKGVSIDDPCDRRNIAVKLRILVGYRDPFLREGEAGIFDEESEIRMTGKHILEQQRITC